MNDKPVFARELRWDLKKPCSDCPFLKSSQFHNGVAQSLPGYAKSIEEHRFSHSCHKTDNRKDCDGPHNHDGPVQHCAGAWIMLLKSGNGVDLQLPLLEAAQEGRCDIDAMTEIARKDKSVFTFDQLVRFYRRHIKRMIESLGRKKRKKGARAS